MFFKNVLQRKILILLAMIAASGCGNDSDRVAQVALEGSQRQAAQNLEMAQLNRDVADATKRLTEERGEADRQILAFEQNLQHERDELERERRQIASARNRESLLVPVLESIGTLAVCILPLVLCWYLLHALGKESSESAVSQVLVEELLKHDDPLPLQPASAIELPQSKLA